MPGSTGCVLNSEVWSDGDCKLARDVTCPTSHTVAVTRAQTANASEISGTMTFTITSPVDCSGTYQIDAVRQ
jgi:hypothetical protein